MVHLGEVLDDDTVAAVVAWLDAGGPGVAAVPETLHHHLFTVGLPDSASQD